MYYVYEWYVKTTGEIIYVGKGSKKRYLSKQHNYLFKELTKRFECESRIIKKFEKEEDAYLYEFERINELKEINQCVCNIMQGGYGGGNSYKHNCKRWTAEERLKYSKNNVMKDEKQRERMKNNNPMKNKVYALKNGIKHRKPFVIGNKEYQTLEEASKEYKVTIQCIKYYLKKGYDNNNNKCYYK